jgi:large subunit ribosomal protein L4
MVDLPVFNSDGEIKGERSLAPEVFEVSAPDSLVAQAVRRQWWNAKPASAHTKGRGEVRGGGRKPWRQKGTGRARQGSIRAPQWVGGGAVHAPLPGIRRPLHLNKKMGRKALCASLSRKTSAGNLMLLDSPDLKKPDTKKGSAMINTLGLSQLKVLCILDDVTTPLAASLRNLPNLKILPSLRLNVLDILECDKVLITLPALDQVEKVWAK